MGKATNSEVIKLALKYEIDGNSLQSSLRLAQNKIYGASKGAIRRSKKQTDEQMSSFIKQSKQTTHKILVDKAKSERVFAKKKLAIEKKESLAIERIKTKAVRDGERQRSKIERDAAKKKKNSFRGGFSNFAGKLGTISSYGAAISVIQGVRKAITFAVSSVIEFETAFTDLAVKSGFTSREMSKVSDTIFQVAAATKFSTSEIIGSATALGKLGFEANEVAQVLPNLANVAAATGESLQATAEILGKVINAYEYTAEQSGIISDRMVDIFNNSALNLEKFNTAFSYVGSAAASTGTSFDELTAAMAILSDRGITASKIGTGLRNVFTKLGREGDSLRDILQRVSDEHLSFYEVAELVGRRAANQLFIMANSLDEFDNNVARSMTDYGEALKAAAKQQSTFQAKWDIMNNSFKNAFAPTFDPNEDFRTAMDESIGLMDMLNSTFGSDVSEAIMTRMLALFPQIGTEFKKMKETLEPGTGDREVLRQMILALKETKQESGKTTNEIRLIGKEISALESITASLKLVGDKTNNLSDALLKMDEAKVKNAAEKLAILYSKELNNAIEKTKSYSGTDNSNAFITSIFGTESQFKTGLDKLKEFGTLSVKQYEFLLKNHKTQKLNLLREEERTNGGGIVMSSEDTLVDVLKKQYGKKIKELKDINKGSLEFTEKSLASNKKQIQRSIDDMENVSKELCEKFPAAALSLGIVCDKDNKRNKKKVEDIDRFKNDVSLDAQYGIDKNKLEIQYRNEDDPVLKSDINDKLLLVEVTYRDKLNKLYEDYLLNQESIKDDFIKRNPERASDFNENIERVTGKMINDAATGTKNEDKFNLRDISSKSERYKEEFNEKQSYILKMKTLDNEMKGMDRNNLKDRKVVQDKMNKATDKYYDKDLIRVKKFFDDIEKELTELKAANAMLILNGKSPIDISNTQEIFDKKDGTIDKNRSDKESAKKTGSGKDNREFDTAGATISAFDEVTGLMEQAGNARLEILQQQADAELIIIQGRHDAEMGILDSALNAGIISQEDAANAKERADKRKIQKENKVAKKMFDAQKKQDMQTAIFTGISSTAQAIALAFSKNSPIEASIFAAISSAAIASSTAMNVSGINKRKFIPKKFADGGMVEGASHAQGGVPFTVRGNSGYEMEGGEFIVNKEAVRSNLAELERINGKTRTGKRKFATGGQVLSESATDNSGFSEAVLEALNKPVRAFVTNQDLTTSDSERNALSKKTSY